METWLNQTFDADGLPAGAETDWRVLHHVLDWKPGLAAFGQAPYVFPGGQAAYMWPVSTDIEHADRVAAALRSRGFEVEVEFSTQAGYKARIGGQCSTVEAEAETAPLAIARAVLKGLMTHMIVKR